MARPDKHGVSKGDPEQLCAITRDRPRGRPGKTKVCGVLTIERSGRYRKEGMVIKARFASYKPTRVNPDKGNAPVGLRASLCTTDDPSKLKKYLGYSAQAHHILSCSQFGKMRNANKGGANGQKPIPFKSIMNGCGYDVNNGSNVFFLPSNFGNTKWDDVQRHVGSHNDTYYDAVLNELKKIYDAYKNKNCGTIDWKAVHQDIHDAEDRIFKKLEKGTIWLYDEAEDLFTADNDLGYRSEQGNKTDKGVAWLVTTKRNKKGWYNHRNFPVPSNALP